MDLNVLVTLLVYLGVEVQAQLFWSLYSVPYLPPMPLAQTQFQGLDSSGQFNFGYSGNNQFRAESRFLDGSVQGSYGYVDPNNKVVQVMYVADSGGFRVISGNNLPTVPAIPPTPALPQAVEYTPEVAAARAEFEKTYNELAAKAAAAPDIADTSSSRRKRSILLPALYAFSPAPFLKVNVTEGEPVKDVISPANTQAVEYKEVEKSLPIAPVYVNPTVPFTPHLYSYFSLQ